MPTAEQALHHISSIDVLKITQIDPLQWVKGLATRRTTTNDVREDLVHTLIEYQEKADSLVPYHPFVQEENNLFVKGTRKTVFELTGNGINGPWSRLQAREGLFPLYRKIIESEGPSIALIVSPPGPHDEGYENYGPIYIFSIPKLSQDGQREIQTAYQRIDGFDAQTIEHCLCLLSAFGEYTKITSQSQASETLLTSFTIFPVGIVVPLPSGKQSRQIKTVKDLLVVISQYLPEKIAEKDIQSMFDKNIVGETYQKFKVVVESAVDKIRCMAQTYHPLRNLNSSLRATAARDLVEFFTIFAQAVDLQRLTNGSCPAAKSTTTELNLERDQSEGTHFCPQCGISFTGGNICPYCGRFCL